MSDILTSMAEVADAVAQKAKQADTPFAEQIDALKALTAAYTAIRKHPSDDTDPDEGAGFNFERGLGPAAEEATHEQAVRDRPRRRPS